MSRYDDRRDEPELGEDGLDEGTRRKYLAWLRSQGIPQAPPPPRWRAERAQLVRLEEKIDWAERTKKHAPDPISLRRIEAKIERLEEEAQAIRSTLPEWQPISWEEAAASRGPECQVCREPLSREEAFYLSRYCPRCLAGQPHLQGQGGPTR